jgi:hypothetical protein
MPHLLHARCPGFVVNQFRPQSGDGAFRRKFVALRVFTLIRYGILATNVCQFQTALTTIVIETRFR